MSDESRLVAVPSLRKVTPGAKVTYKLEPTSSQSRPLQGLSCQWTCMNDQTNASFFRVKTVFGPHGTEWRDAQWSFAGHHKIVCRTKRGGETVDFTYEQEVVPIADVLSEGHDLPLGQSDAAATLDSATRYVEIVKQIAKDYPPEPGPVLTRYKDQLAQQEQYRDRLRERLVSTTGQRRYEIKAAHFSAEKQVWKPINVFVAKSGADWVIVDWSNPTTRNLTGEYRGKGATPEQAIRAALKDWDEDNRYADGAIQYEIAGIPDVGVIKGSFATDGSSYWDSVSNFFAWLGMGTALAASLVLFLVPVPGPQAVSALIWTSIFSSTAAATINIGQRANEGFSSWSANAFDILTIVGNMFGAAGVLWSRGAQLTLQTGRGVMRAILIGQVSTDGVQGVLIAADHYDEFARIRSDPSLTPTEKANKILQLAGSLAVNGALIYISVKGTKSDLDNLNLKPKHFEGPTPAEELKKLADPNASLDLTQKKP
ncbi:MAG: hypothetical protein ABW133_04620, partial [Polyangiaceae bacterium]